MRRVCVFCGSSPVCVRPTRRRAGARPRAGRAAGSGLVYGGGNVGLMGVVADAVLAAGGEVVGVIPHALMAREIGHPGVTALHVVDSMHERKALMADRADAFIALPGGVGTFEELFEAITWTQLGAARQALRPAQRRRVLRRPARASSTTPGPRASSSPRRARS